MTDIFISHSSKDEPLARAMYDQFATRGLKVFLSSVSIVEGDDWTQAIFNALREADWVFVLATPAALASSAVQNEIGAALVKEKRVVPITFGMKPEELPTWLGQKQAISADESTIPELMERLGARADEIRQSKDRSTLFALGIAAAALVFLTRN